MDENNTPDSNEPTPEPIPAPTPAPEVPETPPAAAATPPEPQPQPQPSGAASFTANASMKGGPVPFSGPPDPSIPQDEKTQALLCWILGFFVSFIGPLVFLLISKDKPFVYHHAAQCLTLNIALAVLFIICFILTCLAGIGLLLMPFVGLAGLAVAIMGIIAANAGSRFEPPVTGNLSKSLFKA